MSQPQKPMEWVLVWSRDGEEARVFTAEDHRRNYKDPEDPWPGENATLAREVLPVSEDRESDSEKEFCKLIDCSVRMNRKHQVEAYEYLKALVESNPAPQEKAQRDAFPEKECREFAAAETIYVQDRVEMPGLAWRARQINMILKGARWAWSRSHRSRPQSPSPAVVERKFSEEEILKAFAKALKVQDARGWSTGNLILAALLEAEQGGE